MNLDGFIDELFFSLKALIGLYDDDFLSPYQRKLIRRDVARARLTLYVLRRAVT